VWVALARVIRGWARVEQGAFDDGIDELRRGLSAYEATGARLWRAQSLGLLAGALTKAGRHDEGMEAAVDALNLVQVTKEEGLVADLLRIEAELLLTRVEAEGQRVTMHAEKSLTRALTIARAQNARSWELRAASSLARLYWRQGRAAEATGLVKPILERFTEGQDTADLRTARAILSEASGETPHPS
jgi:predicted ATPase